MGEPTQLCQLVPSLAPGTSKASFNSIQLGASLNSHTICRIKRRTNANSTLISNPLQVSASQKSDYSLRVENGWRAVAVEGPDRQTWPAAKWRTVPPTVAQTGLNTNANEFEWACITLATVKSELAKHQPSPDPFVKTDVSPRKWTSEKLLLAVTTGRLRRSTGRKIDREQPFTEPAKLIQPVVVLAVNLDANLSLAFGSPPPRRPASRAPVPRPHQDLC